jgi:tetratricopeptide (TPR) repeat protein
MLLNTSAHNAYIEGRTFFLPTDRDIKKKLESLYIAIERDPKFAPSYAELALAYFICIFRDNPPVVTFARMRELASRCLELDSSLARAHTVMAAFYLFGARNWPRAQASSKRAVKLNPSDPWARIIRAAYHIVVEEPENAMKELEQARQLGPKSAELTQWSVVFGFYARHYDWAIECGQEMLQLDPFPGSIHAVLGACFAQKGNNALAVQHCEAATALGKGPFVGHARAASTYVLAGNRTAAERLLQELVVAEEREYVRYMFLAQASVALGNDERTLDWLEKAYEQSDPLLVFLKADPSFDPLLGLPRFRRLLRRIGLPVDQERRPPSGVPRS